MTWLKHIPFSLFFITYPPLAFAMSGVDRPTLWTDLSNKDVFMSLLIALVAANVAGIGRTATKLKNPTAKVKNLWFEIASDQIGACLAGAVMFAVCEAYGLGSFAEIALIMLAGYAGSAAMDAAEKTFVGGIGAWLRRAFGLSKGDAE